MGNRFYGAFLLMLVLASACADATLPRTTHSRAADGPGQTYIMDPITVEVDPTCNPWLDADWCEGEGSQCMSATGETTLATCGYPIGGGTQPDDGNIAPVPPSPGDGVAAEEEGILLWGTCILALVGSVYSIDQVGSKFKTWWDAKKMYDRAKTAYDFAWDNRESLVDPSMLAVTQLRMEYAEQRLDDAVGAVRDATGVSALALIAAGVACLPAAVAPTP